LAALLSQNVASAGVRALVVSNTIMAGRLLAAGQAAATGAIPVKAAALAEGVMMTMLFTRLEAAVALVLMLGFVATGATIMTCRTAAGRDGEKPTAENPVEPAAKQEKEKEGFTAWSNEVGGLQAGLGFHPGQKRADRHGETVKLVVRVRNVGKEQVQIALASFKAGVCVSANLDIGQFDSHANNDPDQMRLIPEFLAGIAYLVRRAGELKIREQLVVVVQSEMGRTPNYNAGNRKDHWSIVSALFLGRGIKGDRVIGATDDKQFTVPLDPQTLKPAKDKGIRVRPEHIHESLRQLAGIADHPLSKKFPLGVADKEKLRGFWG
jgi:hypothetical protein